MQITLNSVMGDDQGHALKSCTQKKTVMLLLVLLTAAGCATLPHNAALPDAVAIDAEAQRLMAREILEDTRMPWTWEYDWLDSHRQK